MNIVALDGHTLSPSGDVSWDVIARHGRLSVHERTPADHILERSRDADVVLTNKVVLSRPLLEQLTQLKLICITATGYNNVDVAAATDRRLVVCNVPGYGTVAVAQFVFALLLELCHHVGLHDAAVKDGEWARSPDWCFWKTPLIELAGKTIGIVGLGKIGTKVAELARAFDMNVIAFHPSRKANPASSAPIQWREVEEIFSEADVVSLHCPQTRENAGLVNRRLLQHMKPSAFLINTARGGLVVERDLADALNAGVLAGAALDVVSVEPIAADNPLLTAKNCIITPHIAWATQAARQRIMDATATNIAAFLAGRPIHVVNPRR